MIISYDHIFCVRILLTGGTVWLTFPEPKMTSEENPTEGRMMPADSEDTGYQGGSITMPSSKYLAVKIEKVMASLEHDKMKILEVLNAEYSMADRKKWEDELAFWRAKADRHLKELALLKEESKVKDAELADLEKTVPEEIERARQQVAWLQVKVRMAEALLQELQNENKENI